MKEWREVDCMVGFVMFCTVVVIPLMVMGIVIMELMS